MLAAGTCMIDFFHRNMAVSNPPLSYVILIEFEQLCQKLLAFKWNNFVSFYHD